MPALPGRQHGIAPPKEKKKKNADSFCILK